jgi:glycosyltransferase involved in cell wall biosynthesis
MSDRFSRAIVVNCEFLKKHLVEDEHVPARKVRLCYNGVDIERFYRIPGPKPAPLRNSSLVVGTACALRPEKDLHTLIEGFARTRSALPGITLVIVGDGPELRSLQQHALLAGVAHACHFQPAIPDVVPWLSAMDIFVLGSRTEAFSNALMEAMACRCCVIASNVGGNSEMVRNEETGLLFSPGDPAALAETLFRVINDPGLRLRLAARAEDEIRSKFSISTAAAHMAAIYSSFLSASRSSS